MSRIRYHIEMSNRPKPTTTNPITAPERKATCKPLLRLLLAPWAVLAEAFVAHLVAAILAGNRPELEKLERDLSALERCTPPFPRVSYEEALALGLDIGEPTAIVLARGQLAVLSGGDAGEALEALRDHETRLGRPAQMRARFLLYLATGEREHLEEARRHLDHLRDHAPEESRGPMMERVDLHRRIRDA